MQALKHFRSYIGHTRIVAFLPLSMVNDILYQQVKEEIRYQGFKGMIYSSSLAKFMKGRGLVKLLTQKNEEAIQLGGEPSLI